MNRGCAILLLAGFLCHAADDAQSALTAAETSLAAGDYAHAVDHAEQAAAGFHSRHDQTNEKLAENIAGSASLYRGDYDVAIVHYRAALQIDRRQHDVQGEITRLTNIGSVYFYRGRYPEALSEYQAALRRVLQTGTNGQLVYSNLATLYQQLGDNQKALDYYQQALAAGKTADLLANAATLYRVLGDTEKALDHDRAALELAAAEHRAALQVRVLQHIGVVQAEDLHDLNSALLSFSEAIKVAHPSDLPLAHLYRGEALYRTGRTAAATEDFRAAGDNWLSLYRLGDIAKALAVKYTPLPSGFFPAHRELFDAAIRQLVHGGNPDPERLFQLLERAHDAPQNLPSLKTVQSKLAAGSMLVEHWEAGGEAAALWATASEAGISPTPPMHRSGITQLLIVPDGAPRVEQSVVSYLPYASLLVRDEPWRTPLMPWRADRTVIASTQSLYSALSPIVTFAGAGESLYPAEIRSLPLAQIDLMILSVPDPDLVLSRAFLAAGARSTLSVLKPLPAKATRGVEERFLSNLARGESKALALQHTRLAYPEYGAAFVLMGDGQQPTRPVLSWWWPAGALSLVAGVIIVFLRR